MKICLLNETKSFLFHFFRKLTTLFHFSVAGKKPAYLPLYAFEITKVSSYKCWRLSRLLVQRINEFKMNEIQLKTPQQNLKPS